MDTPLAVPLAHHGCRGPANQGLAMIASDPQKMLFAHASWSVKTDRHSPFNPFMRRRDDPIAPQFDRRPLGALSILREVRGSQSPPRGGVRRVYAAPKPRYQNSPLFAAMRSETCWVPSFAR